MAVPRMTTEQLTRRLEATSARPVVLDVRLKYPYAHSTIVLPGAVRLAPGDAHDPILAALPPDQDLVLYDSDPDELVAERAAAALIRAGRRAFALQGGIAAWVAARLPTDRKSVLRPAVLVPGVVNG